MSKDKPTHESCCIPVSSCGCGCYGFRRFYTAQEKREHVERYAEQLKKELAAVEEHLKNM